ncbi:conserved hypothetical protein [Altererythrobacter sp. B11]|uniref:alpha/beta hydrolase n=1 Tax=Altererythrobacter sp. B11 TaxID=2060312 RepID=UPI000DC72734|nr:alpha/beta hydrolase [Altererythrobacter sp. B11]BBC73462.1 conserved hypothetical protein [Altererythrobacter sp. B11]
MSPELRERIEALGLDLSPPMMQATQAIFAESFRGMDAVTQIERDLAYGPDERHRLDLFRRADTANAPVLVYVHGGGFVMGNKRSPDLPFYDNVGDFAARSGMIGVTVNYRLAPQHPWPAGPEDMGRLVAWLQVNIAEHGGDPARIFLMGQSAGAVHVASYVAHPRFHPGGSAGLAGALLISCIYDVAAAQPNPFHIAYYGEDAGAYPACSTLEGLIDTQVPLLATVSEFDVVDFQKQAAAFVTAHAARRDRYPRLLWLAGHNHLSPALEIGSPDSALEPAITQFIAHATS